MLSTEKFPNNTTHTNIHHAHACMPHMYTLTHTHAFKNMVTTITEYSHEHLSILLY